MDERFITSIDLGSSKFAITVAKVDGDDIQILYYKETPSDGVRYSTIFNPMKVTNSLREAVREAEDELHLKIIQAVTGLPRNCIKQETAQASDERNGGCITKEEVESMKSLALDSYPLNDTSKEEIYGAVAQSYSTEDAFQQIESDIIGMPGERLEGNYLVFVGSRRATGNIDTVFNNLGIAIARKYFVPEITAKAVLKNDELENGVAIIDFGAGVTSVSVYQGNIMRHFASIPFGGQTITNDIKTESGISGRLAENIKLAYGVCMPDRLLSLSEKFIQVDLDGSTVQITLKYLSEIITTRVKEIIDAILYEIQLSGYADRLRSGIVLTGGGANLTNCANYIKALSGYNVRIGFPKHLFSCDGLSGVMETEAVTSMGMILAAKNDRVTNCVSSERITPEEEVPIANVEESVRQPDPAPLQDNGNADTGVLIAPEEFGEKEKKPKAPKKKYSWIKKAQAFVGSLYDDSNDENV